MTLRDFRKRLRQMSSKELDGTLRAYGDLIHKAESRTQEAYYGRRYMAADAEIDRRVDAEATAWSNQKEAS